MNIEKNLILIKGEDKTEKIRYCKYENGKYTVTFQNGKSYRYNYNNLQWISDYQEIVLENMIVYENNIPLSGIVKMIQFNQFIRIWFKNGYNKLVYSSNIVIERSALVNKKSNNIFAYLKSMANMLKISTEEDKSFLANQYEKIKCISPKSVLAKYLEPDEIIQEEYNKQIIFPFGFNISQRKATENAMKSQISIMEGPPGTGKTNTILNILANAIINNKTVAIVSNNNSATANVLEKLQDKELDFIAAYLGNRDNKEKFIQNQSGEYPNLNDYKKNKEEIDILNEELKESEKKLNEMLEISNEFAVLKQQLSELKVEEEYFNEYSRNNVLNYPLKTISKISADKVMSFLVEYEYMLENNMSINYIEKAKFFFRYGIISFRFYKNSPEDTVEYLKKLYYELKGKELTHKISELEAKLNLFNFRKHMVEYTDKSMQIFKAYLAEKYEDKEKRTIFDVDNLWKQFAAIINEYPVVLSTTHSLRTCIKENYLFDYVIVDEASQVDVVTGALALSCAKKVVVVGDLNQLPNVVTNEIREKCKVIAEEFEINNYYKYEKESLLSSIANLFKDIPRTLLKEHYRCHPKIIGFCNKKFYNNELIICTNEKDDDKPLMVYKTVKGNHERNKYNQRQIDIIKDEVIPNLKKEAKEKSIGIISPYRNQITKLKEEINDESIKIDTVHKFQGQEKDIIILSTVANEINDFIDDSNLINVAVSRAKDKLILVAADIADENTNIGDLIRYIEYNNFEVIDSEINSVFDLLYKGYEDKLMELLKKHNKVSEYNSENLMNILIEKVLANDEFSNLDKVVHQPLRMLIKDPSKLNEEEYRFAMNILTHTDFLLFNKVDKMPVLVVEVDGYDNHVTNEKQRKRDEMKDEILRKYNIPIIRLRTNGSMEEKKLRAELQKIIICETNKL